MKRTTIALLGLLLLATAAIAISLPALFARQAYTGATNANASPSVAGVEQESPLPTPITPNSPSQAYHFGEPQLIYEDKGPIWIGDWQSDNRTITFAVTALDENADWFDEIKVFDTEARTVQLSGRRKSMLSYKPVWLPELQAMAYLDASQPDQDGRILSSQLWISTSRDSMQAETTRGELSALTGYGKTLLTIQRDTGVILELDSRSSQIHELPINVKTYGLDPTSPYLQMLSHPSLPLLAVFDHNGFLVVNLRDNEVKQIDLGEDKGETYWGRRWVIDAEWDARKPQIALNVVVGMPVFDSTRLFVLDAASGKSSQVPVLSRWILDMTWAPDSSQLLLWDKTDNDLRAFHLVNTLTGTMYQVDAIPPMKYDGRLGWNVNWSPDGSKLAVSLDNQLYLLSVTNYERETP